MRLGTAPSEDRRILNLEHRVATAAAFSADSQCLAVGTLDGHLWVCEARPPWRHQLSADLGGLYATAIAFTPDGIELAAATGVERFGRVVWFRRSETSGRVEWSRTDREIDFPAAPASALHLSEDGRSVVVTCAPAGVAFVYDGRDPGRPPASLSAVGPAVVLTVSGVPHAVSPNDEGGVSTVRLTPPPPTTPAREP